MTAPSLCSQCSRKIFTGDVERVCAVGARKFHRGRPALSYCFQNRAMSFVVAVCTAQMRRFRFLKLLFQSVNHLSWTNTQQLVAIKYVLLGAHFSKRLLELRHLFDQGHLFQLAQHHLLLQFHQCAGQIHYSTSHHIFITQSDEAFGDIARCFCTGERCSNPVNHLSYPLSLVVRMVQRARRCVALAFLSSLKIPQRAARAAASCFIHYWFCPRVEQCQLRTAPRGASAPSSATATPNDLDAGIGQAQVLASQMDKSDVANYPTQRPNAEMPRSKKACPFSINGRWKQGCSPRIRFYRLK